MLKFFKTYLICNRGSTVINNQFLKVMIPKLNSAVLHARSRLPYKSANKFYPNKNNIGNLMYTNPHKYRLHSLGGDMMRQNNLRSLRALHLSSSQTNQKLEQDYHDGIPHAGNCSENATLAFYYLSNHIHEYERKTGMPIVIMRVAIRPPVDHCLVLVGTQTRYGSEKLIENTLICDPWAKIVCPLDHYSLEWKMKMNKWSNRGLKGKCPNGIYDHFDDYYSREAIRVGKFVIFEKASANGIHVSGGKTLYSLIDRNHIS